MTSKALRLIMMAVVGILAACSSPSGPQRGLTVFAASSLTDALEEVGAAFHQERPDVRLSFNFAASSTLRAQLELGARADLFASADMPQMDLLQRADALLDVPEVFAANSLVLIVPEGSDAVRTPADIADPGVRLALALPSVPAGAYALIALERMGASAGFDDGFYRRAVANVATQEINVRRVFARVALGEVDAGIVYLSDVAGDRARGVDTIPLSQGHNVTALYPVAVLRDAREPELARQFVSFLFSPTARAILAEHGFQGVPS
ncbi:MAG: molybdate ABC transporter substrate-binding protein [Chloroflexi bacterium]|nr:molybdate ABC transporter substrate-binding protein [Chloroflexota bacterium]